MSWLISWQWRKGEVSDSNEQFNYTDELNVGNSKWPLTQNEHFINEDGSISWLIHHLKFAWVLIKNTRWTLHESSKWIEWRANIRPGREKCDI